MAHKKEQPSKGETWAANEQSSGQLSTNPHSSTNLGLFAALTEEEQAQLLANYAQERGDVPVGAAVPTVRPTPLAQLLARDYPPLTFVVDGLLAKGQLVMLGGRPKSGKSWLLLQLAQAVDLGLPFLGRPVVQGRVLYIALEDGERRIFRRCHTLNWQPSSQAAVLFSIPSFDGEGTVGAGVGVVASFAADYDLIIIDTLIATLSGRADENSNPQMGGIMNELARIAHGSDIAIMVVHHTNKAMGSDNVFNSLRGASALRGAYDAGLVLDRKQDEKEAILHLESRDVELDPLTIRQTADKGGWEWVGDKQALAKIRAGRRVVEVLQEQGDGQTAEHLAEALGITTQAAGEQLRGAEKQGLVKKKSQKVAGSTRPVNHWYLVTPA